MARSFLQGEFTPVLRRCQSGQPFEQAAKKTAVPVTHQRADILHRIGGHFQRFPGFFHPQTLDLSIGRFLQRLTETTLKRDFIHANVGSNAGDQIVFGQMGV